MNLPTEYAWLTTLGTLPRTITEAVKLLGVVETVGKGSNRTIMSWRDELNVAAGVDPLATQIVGYGDDGIPWCGLFAAIVTYRAGKDVVNSPLWARNWTALGIGVQAAGLGDVLVFERPGGGGHVGFYVAEDATAYHVIGGNQSDKVCITRIKKDRCIAKRRPVYTVQPDNVKPYRVSGGGALSQNES